MNTPSMISHTHLRQAFLSLALAAGIVFALMTGIVYSGRMHKVDFDLTVKIQDRSPRRLDDNLAVLIDFGSMEIQAVLFLVILILLPLPKKTKVLLTGAYVFGLCITLLGKTFLPHPAPPYMFQRGNQGLAFPGLHVQVDSSYPSGHTYRVTFLAALLTSTWIINDRKKIWLGVLTVGSVIFAAVILGGLIVLGKHWTSDVIGGIGLSIFLVSVCMATVRIARHTTE